MINRNRNIVVLLFSDNLTNFKYFRKLFLKVTDSIRAVQLANPVQNSCIEIHEFPLQHTTRVSTVPVLVARQPVRVILRGLSRSTHTTVTAILNI